MGPQEICRSYYRAASIGKKVLSQTRKDELADQLADIRKNQRIRPEATWDLLEEIDQALWSGRLLLGEIGLTLAEWKTICQRYFFETLYVHHAVPEAFQVPRIFDVIRKLEGFPNNNLVLSHNNTMNSAHIPYRDIKGKVKISPGVYIELDRIITDMIGDGKARIKRFVEGLPVVAYAKMLDIGNESIIEA